MIRYYSEIDAHSANGSAKLDCAWLGSKGWDRNYATAIRIHFPEFAATSENSAKDVE